jgi:hypothetical protein
MPGVRWTPLEQWMVKEPRYVVNIGMATQTEGRRLAIRAILPHQISGWLVGRIVGSERSV